MAKASVQIAGAEVVLADGIVAIPTEQLCGLIPQDYSKTGVVLANDRRSFLVGQTDPETGKPIQVEYTLSVYVQRGAVTEAEAHKVASVSAERTANQKAREVKLAEALAREKREMFSLGIQAAREVKQSLG